MISFLRILTRICNSFALAMLPIIIVQNAKRKQRRLRADGDFLP